MESNVEIKVEELSDQFEAFYKVLSEEVDKKFAEIEAELRQKELELLEATKLELIETGEISKTMKRLEAEVFSGEKIKKNLEDVNKYKAIANTYIEKCETLDGYFPLIQNITLEDLLTVNKSGLQLHSKKIDYIKRFLAKNGKTAFVYKWLANQKKPCTITEEGNSMKVNYSSCWNDFHSTPIKSGQHEIILEMNITMSSIYHSIGITNEIFNGVSNCLGCQNPANAWVLKLYGSTLNVSGLSQTCDVKLANLGKFVITILLDCDNKTVAFKDSEGRKSPPYPITGMEFTVTVGMCTGATCTYKFLDSK